MTAAPLTAAEARRLLDRPALRGVPRLQPATSERSARIGTGRPAFDRAADVLLGWGVQQRAGLEVAATDPVVAVGVVVRQTYRWAGVALHAPCQVTEVWRDADRCGFTYRTLAGHPEQGTETFALTLHDDGAVLFTVTAVSRPGTWWTVLGLPVMRLVQRRIVSRYLQAP